MNATAGRAAAMTARVLEAAARAGIAEPGVRSIEAALDAAMQPRIRRLADDHDPAYLHPGRTVLILLEDAGVTDPAVLSAGALTESLRPDLAAAPPAAVRLAPDTLELLAEVPTPAHDRDTLLERLVSASAPARLVALAERLDHVRHLHLLGRSHWAPLHRETRDIYLPVADRTDPTLARRLRYWCTTFAERFLPDAGTRRAD
ncbi:MAG TPA: hypothetical protein VF158_04530 [Longimicrobiales bacterium]